MTTTNSNSIRPGSPMLLHAVHLSNFLSFSENAEPLALGPLNVVTGPNGSGKSNLLESIDLLRSAPGKLLTPIREVECLTVKMQ